MFVLMIISSVAGALVAVIGFSSYASDIQLTIAFVGCAWCLISAGIAGVLQQLSSLRKYIEERQAKPHAEGRGRPHPQRQEQYRDQRRDPDFN